MSDDIVDRLTEWASIGWDAQVDPLQKHTDDTLDYDLSEAAGEIVRLRAEVEHEREQSDEWAKTLDAIDALHQPVIDSEWLVKRCEQCDMEWPCRTHLLIHPITVDDAIDTLGTVHK